ncbi:unnamed protein product [Prorocentrum cordatum]|uniref:Tudor domain-containing protein n=1 Tax=Prorocentrum cordatum TaxID=2364126 RepID=A0ABN9PUP2_9DINO|nr:unnamed protein product [Polarella glacialis]
MTCGCGLLVSPRRAFAIVLGAALVAAPRLVYCAASWHGDGGLRVGDRVEALRWHGATIIEDLGGGRFVVDWDDGHGSQRARGPSQLRAAPAEPLAAGDRVEALFDEDGKWYPATVPASWRRAASRSIGTTMTSVSV